MKLLLELSKQNPDLSVFEAAELLGLRKYKLIANYLYISFNTTNLMKSLAYTNVAYQVLFSCSKKVLNKKIKSFSWQKHYEKDFCVRNINLPVSKEKDYASLIWHKLKKPMVNLTNPSTEFVFIKLKKRVYATKRIWRNPKNFLRRKAHLRPEMHPSSLDPRLAKACVNIAIGAKKDAVLLDPFCGTGGILIEAALMGANVIGYDIDEIMLRKARINLGFYKRKNYKLENKDALAAGNEKKITAIVTDLPYGRNTKSVNLVGLIKDFLSAAYKITNRAVIMFPSTINYKPLLGRWKLKREFEYYLHSSLTKKILVLIH